MSLFTICVKYSLKQSEKNQSYVLFINILFGYLCQASAQYVESLFAAEFNAVVTALGHADPKSLDKILYNADAKPVGNKLTW